MRWMREEQRRRNDKWRLEEQNKRNERWGLGGPRQRPAVTALWRKDREGELGEENGRAEDGVEDGWRRVPIRAKNGVKEENGERRKRCVASWDGRRPGRGLGRGWVFV